MAEKRNRAPQGYATLMRSGGQMRLSVPGQFHKALEPLIGKFFECSLSDEGIVFKPADVTVTEIPEIPEWVSRVMGDSGAES